MDIRWIGEVISDMVDGEVQGENFLPRAQIIQFGDHRRRLRCRMSNDRISRTNQVIFIYKTALLLFQTKYHAFTT